MEDKEQEIIDAIETTDILEEAEYELLQDIESDVLWYCWNEIKDSIAEEDKTVEEYTDEIISCAMYYIPDVLERNFKYAIKKILKIKEEVEHGSKENN